MPNHITNVLSISGEQEKINDCLNTIKGSYDDGTERPIDFDKIVPMPKTLHITSGSAVDNAIAVLQNDVSRLKEMLEYQWVKRDNITDVESLKNYLKKSLTEKDFSEAQQAIDNIRLYGHKDWYSWSIAYWGTKWNAYDAKTKDNQIIFDTAWSTPFPVIDALSKMYPDLTFKVEFADEDIGSNCGSYTIQKGVLINEYIPTGFEAIKYAKTIKGWDEDLLETLAGEIPYVRDEIFNQMEDDIVKFLSDKESNIDLFIGKLSENCEYNDNEFEVFDKMKKLLIKNELYEFIGKFDEVLNKIKE